MSKIKEGFFLRSEFEFPFCPGCGHSPILTNLDKAIGALNLDPLKTVIVTDIGCIGLSDRFFDINAFHGLHGRSITYACGIKMANPDLKVITLMGDGGLGIGGAHFLNAARRNIDITVIVANNFNFGMTGGEHSVTTPHGGKTSSTFLGNIEFPIDACELVKAVNGGFAARTTTFEKNIVEILTEAINFPGFSIVDIWEYCTAYYVPRNKFNKTEMMNLLNQYGFKTGVIHKSERNEYVKNYMDSYVKHSSDFLKKTKAQLNIEFDNNVTRKTEIVLAGAAGQKIKSSSTIFGNASLLSGLYATQKDDYPITVMTGHSISEIILDNSEITFSEINSPDYIIIIDIEGLNKVKHLIPKMTDNCMILVDTTLANQIPETNAIVKIYPFIKTASSFDKGSIAIVSLSAFLEITKLFPIEALKSAIKKTQKDEIAQLSFKAIEEGLKLCLKST